MNAIREIVTRDIFNNYDVPDEFGDEFEMILLPVHTSSEKQSRGLDKDHRNSVSDNERFLASVYASVILEDSIEDEIWSKYL